jgi:hypothetical protein
MADFWPIESYAWHWSKISERESKKSCQRRSDTNPICCVPDMRARHFCVTLLHPIICCILTNHKYNSGVIYSIWLHIQLLLHFITNLIPQYWVMKQLPPNMKAYFWGSTHFLFQQSYIKFNGTLTLSNGYQLMLSRAWINVTKSKQGLTGLWLKANTHNQSTIER